MFRTDQSRIGISRFFEMSSRIMISLVVVVIFLTILAGTA